MRNTGKIYGQGERMKRRTDNMTEEITEAGEDAQRNNGHQKQKAQSKKMIEDALFELMREKNFAQIRVSEIVDRADVARRTFYRLYQGKEDVIRDYFNRLCGNYCSSHGLLNRYDLPQISGEFFGFWYRHREILLLMHKAGLESMLYYEIRRASAEVVKSRIGNRTLQEAPELEYFADYSVGGFTNLLYRWVLEGMKEPPDQYAEKVGRSLLKFICMNQSVPSELSSADMQEVWGRQEEK